MNSNIDKIVINAIEDLADMFPNTVQEIAKNDYFITHLQICDEYGRANGGRITIVDFTKQMTYDEQEFGLISQQLYNRFMVEDKWYEC